MSTDETSGNELAEAESPNTTSDSGKNGSSNASASHKQVDPRLATIIQFAAKKKIYYYIDRGRFNGLPMKLQALSTNATEEFVQLAGIAVSGAQGDVFAFSSEELALQYKPAIKELPKYRNRELVPIAMSPARLLVSIEKYRPGPVYINYGSPEQVELGGAEINHLERLALMVRIATEPAIYVLQARDGTAITLEEDDGLYGIAYLNKADARTTIEGMQLESPGCGLGANKPLELVQNILASDNMRGLVFNPASAVQTFVGRDELQMIELAGSIIRPPSMFDAVKKLFKK